MFLYIDEEGEMWQTKTPPTDDDFTMVSDGVIQVLKFNNGEFIDITVHGSLTIDCGAQCVAPSGGIYTISESACDDLIADEGWTPA